MEKMTFVLMCWVLLGVGLCWVVLVDIEADGDRLVVQGEASALFAQQDRLLGEVDRYWRMVDAGVDGDRLAAHRAYIDEQAGKLPADEVPGPVRMFLNH